LVALQLDVLLKSSQSIAAIKKALNTLPTTLDKFYDYILRVIDEQHEQKAYAVLQWLAFSARPLLLSELAVSIIIQPRSESYLDPDETLMDEDQVLDFLPAGLVRKVFKTAQGQWSRLPYVQLAHFSVLEYLKSSRMCSDLRLKYQIEEINAHTMIAEACLAYLLYIGETETELFAEDTQKLFRYKKEKYHYTGRSRLESWWLLRAKLNSNYPLADYALTVWHYHLCRLESTSNECLDRLASKFLKLNANSWTIWCYYGFEDQEFFLFGLLNPGQQIDQMPRTAQKIHPVTWISWLGLSGYLKLLLKETRDLSQLQTNGYFGNPLHAAAAKGNAQIVRILLQSQADVNQRGGYYGAPLIAASRSGSLEVQKLLLDLGADENEGAGSE
jgi:hypothetical protein